MSSVLKLSAEKGFDVCVTLENKENNILLSIEEKDQPDGEGYVGTYLSKEDARVLGEYLISLSKLPDYVTYIDFGSVQNAGYRV